MRSRELSEGEHGKTFVLVFEAGEEAFELLSRWCKENEVAAARFTGVGAFERAEVAWFDWDAREYRPIPIEEQVEVLSLLGDVAEQDGDPVVHAHVVLGTREGLARGGHLRSGVVRPTLELVVDEAPAHLRKRHDPESGLALIDPRA